MKEIYSASNQRLAILERKSRESDKTIAEAIATVTKVMQDSATKIHSSAHDRIAQIEKEVITRVDETQQALSMQIDIVTMLWEEVASLRTESQERAPSTRTDLMDCEGYENDDLISSDNMRPW